MSLTLLLGSACGLIYKQNIQQGNALEQKDLDELYIGMNKRQVSFVLGSPSIHDPFHQQRWDYVQTFSRRGGPMVQRTVTLRFEEDLLVEIIGVDKTPSAGDDATPAAGGSSSGTTQAAADPHTSSVEAATKEATEPEIKGLGNRSAEDRKLEDDMGAMDQRNADDVTSPDIDG
jgi:outer membrane protein assembly factor BamE (lipoprotein component of BamABCDE complex)